MMNSLIVVAVVVVVVVMIDNALMNDDYDYDNREEGDCDDHHD